MKDRDVITATFLRDVLRLARERGLSFGEGRVAMTAGMELMAIIDRRDVADANDALLLTIVERAARNLENFPRIVCLCGSLRFIDQIEQANVTETLAGRIVLTVGASANLGEIELSDEEKARIDELHDRKIDLADEILVVDVGGYIGESTRREIEHARSLGRPVRYWSKGEVVDPEAAAVAGIGGATR